METRICRRPVGRYGHKPFFCRPLCWVLGLAFLASAATAHAQPQDATASTVPWVPNVIQSIDQYVPQRLGLDHFAASNSADQVGMRTVQLSNGNQLVVGLVPDGNGNTCNDGTAMCSIGMVQYSLTDRVPWSNPGGNGRYFDNYAVYPGGSATSSSQYQFLRDVKVRGHLIDVLVDVVDFSRPEFTLGRHNVKVVTFRDNGSYFSQFYAFGIAGANFDNTDFYGAQMVEDGATQMIVVATAYDSVGASIAVTRLAELSNGEFGVDSSWGYGYNGNLSQRLIGYYAPGAFCQHPLTGNICNVTASYAIKPDAATSSSVYIEGSVNYDGEDWDVMVLKISHIDGTLRPEFSGGWRVVRFDDTNSSRKDVAAGIYGYQDEIYLGAQVAREYHPGIGLAKVNGATGNSYSAFGAGGKTIFGGVGHDEQYPSNWPDDHIPTMISATGGRIGVVGYHVRDDHGNTLVDPFLAVVNSVTGARLDFRDHLVRRADGSRAGDAIFYGVYGGPSYASPFTVSGLGRDTNAGNTLSYLSGRLLPLSGDRIFASGFGTGDEH